VSRQTKPGTRPSRVVDKSGKRVCQVNIFLGKHSLIVDVIDIDKRFAHKRALCFTNRGGYGDNRRVLEAFEESSLVSVDFRRKEKGDDEA
jgi:hypothetical protein